MASVAAAVLGTALAASRSARAALTGSTSAAGFTTASMASCSLRSNPHRLAMVGRAARAGDSREPALHRYAFFFGCWHRLAGQQTLDSGEDLAPVARPVGRFDLPGRLDAAPR